MYVYMFGVDSRRCGQSRPVLRQQAWSCGRTTGEHHPPGKPLPPGESCVNIVNGLQFHPKICVQREPTCIKCHNESKYFFLKLNFFYVWYVHVYLSNKVQNNTMRQNRAKPVVCADTLWYFTINPHLEESKLKCIRFDFHCLSLGGIFVL